MTPTRRQFLKIGLIVGLVVLLGVVLMMRPVGSTFANHNGQGGGGLQLTIDSYSIYNGEFRDDLSWELKDLVPGVDRFFNFGDIKPGDTGLNTISIHVADNPAYVCLDFTNLVDDENGMNEPESLVDVTVGGDLSGAIEFFAWRDDGNNVFDVGERPIFGTSSQAAVVVLNDTSYPLADAAIEEVFTEDETYYVGITWCAGDLAVDLATGAVSCDGEVMGNEYQTDMFTVDVSLRAVEATSNTNFRCEGEESGAELYLNKQISGVTEGFELSDFSYLVTGTSTAGEYFDVLVPHDSFVRLPIGTFTIEEIVPDGFVKDDWRIGWYGQCEKGNEFTTTITIEERHLDWGTLYCEADNQYRPDQRRGDNGHGNDEDGNDDSNPGNSNDPSDDTDDDGLPPGQQAAGGPPGQSTQQWTQVENTSYSFSRNWQRNRARI